VPQRSNLWTTCIALAVLVFVVAGCSPASESTGGASCGGIDAQLGGCDSDLPVFVGQTCEEVGSETGRQLNDRLLAIYHGPDDVDDETRAVRANHVMTVTTSLANAYLRSIGIVASCGLDAFVAAGETQFEADFKRLAGVYLNDGPPATFDDWLAEWRSVARVIDMEEN
jgi:hypothetical protein